MHGEVGSARTVAVRARRGKGWCVWLTCSRAVSILLAVDVLNSYSTHVSWHGTEQNAVLDRRRAPRDGWRLKLNCVDTRSVCTQ